MSLGTRPRLRRWPIPIVALAAASACVSSLVLFVPTSPANAAGAAKQLERLDRGAIAVRSGSGTLVSWRLLGTDPQNVSFNVYRGGTKVNGSPLTGATNYLDGGTGSYSVRAVVNGSEQASSSALNFGSGYLDVPISRPSGAHHANDASVGDLDGDGDLDFVLKWEPDNFKDNSQAGVTGNVYIDGITLEGNRLWRINLGRNIRAGAHYTQFQVWDYDGDGDAEVAMKTADATVDGTGKVIGNANADYRNGDGYVLTGPEFFTVFSGQTGAALATADWVVARGSVSGWGDSYGNRVDRFLAATAYLDGVRPSIIMARGYYTRATITAWDYRDGRLTRRWTADSANGTAYAGQGNHNLSVADVDGDGKDEIVYGASAIDDNGTRLWSANTGHGDAMHVGDLDPSRPGLEEFHVSESGSAPSSWLADARTGQIIWQTAPAGDNGRGVSADIWAGSAGAESWSSAESQIRNPRGSTIGRKPGSANFLAWWDADPVRELLDGNHVDKYGTGGDTRLLTAGGVSTNNGTKSNPALSGDILGDWREEVIWRTSDSSALRIYSTPNQTSLRIPTLLHDLQYREALAWQNTAYNQPPHPSFFIGDGMSAAPWPNLYVPGGTQPTSTTTTRPTSTTSTTTTSTSTSTSTSTTTTSTRTTTTTGQNTGGTGSCSASYAIVGSWQGAFQGEVKVTAGSRPISTWIVTFTFGNGQTISQYWGAKVSQSGSAVTATPEAWNGSIGAGASTTFGFIASSNGTNGTPSVTCS